MLGPHELYHRFVYIAPSSDHSLLILNLPFNLVYNPSNETILFVIKFESLKEDMYNGPLIIFW